MNELTVKLENLEMSAFNKCFVSAYYINSNKLFITILWTFKTNHYL